MTRCDGCHYYKPVFGKMMCTWLPHGYSDDALCKCNQMQKENGKMNEEIIKDITEHMEYEYWRALENAYFNVKNGVCKRQDIDNISIYRAGTVIRIDIKGV